MLIKFLKVENLRDETKLRARAQFRQNIQQVDKAMKVFDEFKKRKINIQV